ncbi:UNVERIFIED_CONTAM: Melanoma-associated antigen D2 [Siphonaria sp. JEL0065]|nr:Melanoma-associated antigen D2 [Siphonaria sp. JEL0065]
METGRVIRVAAADWQSVSITIDGSTVIRTSVEVEALFTAIVSKHPLLCFGLVAPLKPKPNNQPSNDSIDVRVRQTTLFIASVAAKKLLLADKEHVAPFFNSVFKYLPDPVQPAPLNSRRSASATALSFVFSKKQDDVDVFFMQVKDHIDAVHKAVRAIVKDTDIMAGMQIDYADALHDLDLKLSEISMQEQLDAIAGSSKQRPYPSSQYRKLTKVINALQQNLNLQSKHLITHFRPVLYAYRRSMECMRVSLDARLVALDDYEDACKLVVKKSQVVERLVGSGGVSGSGVYQSKAESAMFELRKAKEDEQMAKERFISATDTIRESYGTVRNAQAEELQQDVDRFVKGFVRMALACEHRRVPIKREDLIKKVLTTQHSKAYASIFEKSQKVLRNVFGFEMARLDNKTGGRKRDNKGKAKEVVLRQEYILRNILSKDQVDEFAGMNDGAAKTARTTLLCVVLSLVLAEKRIINADSLFKHLETLGIFKNRIHKTFNKIEDVIASFVKEEYLEKYKIDESAANQQQQQTAGSGEEYVWGPRAKIEYTEPEIIAFVAKAGDS